ncbi:MAG: hypothetical protein R3E58_18515 [Phycisphaerae bacterium]|nr:hypothetical protein [Phycisphaerales bacterium]
MEGRLLADDLYRFVVRLFETLQNRGASSLANKVHAAGNFAVGSTTEFFTEAELALKSVLAEHEGVLQAEEIQEVNRVLRGIDFEFKLIGGA